MLKVSTSTAHFKEVFGDLEGLRKIKECGFDSVDFGLHGYQDDEDSILNKDDAAITEYFTKVKKFLDEIDLEVSHTHAPYYFFAPMEEFLKDEFAEIFRKAMLATKVLGSKYIVIHGALCPDYENDFQINYEVNVKYFKKLKPYIKEYGVMIALENMDSINPLKHTGMPGVLSSATKMKIMMDDLGEGFCACLDTGHAFLAGQEPGKMARLLGDRLKVLHMQDGDGVNDMHIPPTCGYIDWDDFLSALHEINYEGSLNFEVDFLRSGAKNICALGGFLCSLGRDFAQRIESMKGKNV